MMVEAHSPMKTWVAFGLVRRWTVENAFARAKTAELMAWAVPYNMCATGIPWRSLELSSMSSNLSNWWAYITTYTCMVGIRTLSWIDAKCWLLIWWFQDPAWTLWTTRSDSGWIFLSLSWRAVRRHDYVAPGQPICASQYLVYENSRWMDNWLDHNLLIASVSGFCQSSTIFCQHN